MKKPRMRKRIILSAIIGLSAATLGLLFVIVFPEIETARSETRMVVCTHNLKLLGLPLQRYAKDHDGRFPDDLMWLTPEYFDVSPKPFVCPEAEIRFEKEYGREMPIATIYANYSIVPGLTLDADPDTVLAYETGMNHDDQRYGVLFVDGRAMRVPGTPPELDTLP